ncbi:c-type cytochrome biogenesis protein CcmI [Methylobacterium thuringiense]|nr:c-type cytochrome biogenesis protein CcmI [Methylobacterium thuringiense]
MTAIWFILAIMTGAAVLVLLWPLTRRRKASPDAGSQAGLTTETGFYEDQLAEIERDLGRGLIGPAEAEAARTEAARRLLRASREGRTGDAAPVAEPHLRQRRAASAFALSTVPLVALVVYGLYGSPNLPSQTDADRKAAQQGGEGVMKAIGQVEAKLASNPNDARGWSVIAPVYMRLGRFDDAARAFEQVVRIQGEDPERLANWGEALVAAGEGAVSPQARKLFERALVLDPKTAKPQFYLARGDELAGDNAGSARRLEALAAQGPEDAPWMRMVRENLARLKGETPPTAQTPKAEAEANAASPKSDEAKPAAGPAANLQALPPNERMAAIRGMVEGLDRRLASQGGSADEWMRLVRSYGALGERDKAREAFQRGRTALAQDPQALARLDAEAKELDLADPGRQGDAGSGAATPSPEEAPAQAMMPSDAPAAPGMETGGSPAAAIQAMPPAEREAAIRGMVAGLDRRLAAKGGTADEWMRLVRSYAALGDREAAAGALDRARMAVAADGTAIQRLDALGRDLDLKRATEKP